jgi:hypothetical protein
MTSKKLFLLTLCFIAAGILIFTSCENPSGSDGGGGGGGGGGWNDTPISSFAGTVWSDAINPESLIEFTSATQVTLTGRYWTQIKPRGVEGIHPYEVIGNYTDPLSGQTVAYNIWILIDADKRTGFEFYYYPAAGTQHQRLIVWYNGHLAQPRPFYLY